MLGDNFCVFLGVSELNVLIRDFGIHAHIPVEVYNDDYTILAPTSMNPSQQQLAHEFQELLHATLGQHIDQVQAILDRPHMRLILQQDQNAMLLQSAVRVNNAELTATFLPHFDPFSFSANSYRLAIFNNAVEAFDQLMPKFFVGSSDHRADVVHFAIKECRPHFLEKLLPNMAPDEVDYMIADAKDIHIINLLIPYSSLTYFNQSLLNQVRKSNIECINALFDHADHEDVLEWCRNNNVSGAGVDHLRARIDAQKTKHVLIQELGGLDVDEPGKKPKM